MMEAPLTRAEWERADSLNRWTEYEELRIGVERLRGALAEAIGWSYGEEVTPERRDELERLLLAQPGTAAA